MNVDFKGVGDWQIENAQRNGIMYGLDDAEPDDLIFISDVDEFPAPDILKRINENKAPLITNCAVPPPPLSGQSIDDSLSTFSFYSRSVGTYSHSHESKLSLVLF